MRILFFVVAASVMVFSCGRMSFDPRLVEAENIMDEDYVTALALLDSVDAGKFSRVEDKALYAMLYTMALDKNHRDPKDDSLISIASDFFTRKGDNRRAVISHYYQGRVRTFNKNLPQAIVSFLRAKELAENDSLYFWIGMSCRGLADLFDDSYNFKEQVVYAEKEYENIRKSGRQPYLNYALLDLSRAYYNYGDKENAHLRFNQVIDSAKLYKDDYLLFCVNRNIALDFMSTKAYNEALPMMLDLSKSVYSEPIDSLRLCYVMGEMGMSENASRLLDSISSKASFWIKLVSSSQYRKSHQYELALQEKEDARELMARELKTDINHEMTSTIIDYYSLNKQLDEAELESSRKTFWLISIILIAAIGVLYFVTRDILMKQRLKYEKKLIAVEELRELSIHNEKGIHTSPEIVRHLLSDKYDMIQDFSRFYLESKDDKVAGHKVAQAVSTIIEDLSEGGKKFIELEAQINQLYGNLCEEFKKDLPKIKREDYRLFLFSVIGFKSNIMAMLLKVDKIESIYNRKRRLKDKIKLLEPGKRDRYLSFLE